MGVADHALFEPKQGFGAVWALTKDMVLSIIDSHCKIDDRGRLDIGRGRIVDLELPQKKSCKIWFLRFAMLRWLEE